MVYPLPKKVPVLTAALPWSHSAPDIAATIYEIRNLVNYGRILVEEDFCHWPVSVSASLNGPPGSWPGSGELPSVETVADLLVIVASNHRGSGLPRRASS